MSDPTSQDHKRARAIADTALASGCCCPEYCARCRAYWKIVDASAIALAEQRERTLEDLTVEDVCAWADGVLGALGTEHSHKVTDREAEIAAAIQRDDV